MLYLAALVFGVGTFLMQALSSSHHGGALDMAHDLHGAGLAHGDASHAQQHEPAQGNVLLSLRFYMFASLGFGIVGAPVTWLDATSPTLTFVVALATGLLVAGGLSFAFRKVGVEATSSVAAPSELVGRVGRVLIPCEKSRRGKVRLSVYGQIVDYVATTDEARLEAGAPVIVEEVHAEHVHVCAAPADLLPE